MGFTNFGEGIQVVDPYTGELHESRKQDVADCTRLIDALAEIDVVERPLGAHDVHPDTAALHNAEAIFSNTTKHATIGSAHRLLRPQDDRHGGGHRGRPRSSCAAGRCSRSSPAR